MTGQCRRDGHEPRQSASLSAVEAVDLALFALRVGVGITLAAHGWNKIRGGLDGTGRWFESMGMRPGWLHARLAAFTEVGAGVALALGLFTPLAGAAFVGLMLVAGIVAHKDNGFFVFRPGQGWEYTFVLGLIGAAFGALGPGKLSLDHALGIDWAGWGGLAVSAGLGLLAGTVLLVATWRKPAGADR